MTAVNDKQVLRVSARDKYGLTWRVAYRIRDIRRSFDVTDDGLAALCAWVADRADNATLIVVPIV